jgi:hypothetical protein
MQFLRLYNNPQSLDHAYGHVYFEEGDVPYDTGKSCGRNLGVILIFINL